MTFPFLTVPNLILKRLYTFGSLENTAHGIQFSIKNRLGDTQFTGLLNIRVDGCEVPHPMISLDFGADLILNPEQVTPDNPIDFPLRKIVCARLAVTPLAVGKHEIEIVFATKQYGKLTLKVDDTIAQSRDNLVHIPRDETDDYSPAIVTMRQRFIESFSKVELKHIKAFAFDPHVVKGNCEHFTGIAQVPLGFAGPIEVKGEYAQGEFLVPLATSEGTLVASYNRGIKLLNSCGGAKCTVSADAMQRAPVFVFDDARCAREFSRWINLHYDAIREEAEATSHIAKLLYIEPFLSNKFVFLRFNFSTGDAAGQNMVGRACFAACSWILEHYEDAPITHFYLESNFATDKKGSQVNSMHTRGKRVTAEITVNRDLLIQHMRVEPESLHYHLTVSNVGTFLSGANNNGAHSANAITAMFIATGQDVANVAESSAGVLFSELTKEGDLYVSLTIPSLIVASYGGGTGLPTQRECLEIMDCYGKGKVNKLAEIVAAVALAGELSLGAAISSSDWVSSHEQLGRHR